MRSRWGWTVDQQTGCWNWTGVMSPQGYGRYNHSRAHRVVFEKYKGEIPAGLTLDHLCRNRRCVNPDHLEPVTVAENLRRGNAPNHLAARNNRCARGHDLADAYVGTYGRQCRRCAAERRLLRERAKGRPPLRRLDDQTVAEIRAAYAAGVRQADLTRRYQVNDGTISRIVRGLSYV